MWWLRLSASVTGWTNTANKHISDTDRPQLQSASERICGVTHTYKTVSTTEFFLLLPSKLTYLLTRRRWVVAVTVTVTVNDS